MRYENTYTSRLLDLEGEYDYKDNIDLIKEYKKTKDERLLEILLIVNYSLIKKQSKKYIKVIEGSCLSQEDLIQVGYIGLLRAIEKFDLSKNTSFSTYALYWIKQSMTREISNRNNSIRIPVYMLEQMMKLKKFEEDLPRDMSDEERLRSIEEKLGIDKARYNEILEYQSLFGNRLTSLDMEIGEGDSIPLSELISVDESSDTVFDRTSIRMLRENIEIGLKSLSEREADILRLRYGMDDMEETTLESIGKKYGLTRERIRQIESKALWKLKNRKSIARLKDGYIDI